MHSRTALVGERWQVAGVLRFDASKTNGSYSIYGNGMPTTNATFDFWLRFSPASEYAYLHLYFDAPTNDTGSVTTFLRIRIYPNTNEIKIYAGQNPTKTITIASQNFWSTTAMAHFAVQFSGNDYEFYMDGALIDSDTITPRKRTDDPAQDAVGPSKFKIESSNLTYIDVSNIRIFDEELYSSNFTPVFVDDSNYTGPNVTRRVYDAGSAISAQTLSAPTLDKTSDAKVYTSTDNKTYTSAGSTKLNESLSMGNVVARFIRIDSIATDSIASIELESSVTTRDAVQTLDLAERKTIHAFDISPDYVEDIAAYRATHGKDYPYVKEFTVEHSLDNATFTTIAGTFTAFNEGDEKYGEPAVTVALASPISARYVRVTATSFEESPAWRIGNFRESNKQTTQISRSLSFAASGNALWAPALYAAEDFDRQRLLKDPIAEFTSNTTIERGSVKVLDLVDGAWVPRGEPIFGERPSDKWGKHTVGISADGNVVASGGMYNDGDAPSLSDDRGHVRVFAWDGAQKIWSQKGSDIEGSTGQRIGSRISLHESGDMIAITGEKEVSYTPVQYAGKIGGATASNLLGSLVYGYLLYSDAITGAGDHYIFAINHNVVSGGDELYMVESRLNNGEWTNVSARVHYYSGSSPITLSRDSVLQKWNSYDPNSQFNDTLLTDLATNDSENGLYVHDISDVGSQRIVSNGPLNIYRYNATSDWSLHEKIAANSATSIALAGDGDHLVASHDFDLKVYSLSNNALYYADITMEREPTSMIADFVERTGDVATVKVHSPAAFAGDPDFVPPAMPQVGETIKFWVNLASSVETKKVVLGSDFTYQVTEIYDVGMADFKPYIVNIDGVDQPMPYRSVGIPVTIVNEIDFTYFKLKIFDSEGRVFREYNSFVDSSLDIGVTRIGDQIIVGRPLRSNMYLTGYEFSNMNLDGQDASFSDLRGTVLADSTLVGANLQYARLTQETIPKTIEYLRTSVPTEVLVDRHVPLLRRAIAGGPDADATSDLRGVDLTGADLRHADLRGADLSTAEYDGTTNFEGAIYDDETLWKDAVPVAFPNDFDSPQRLTVNRGTAPLGAVAVYVPGEIMTKDAYEAALRYFPLIGSAATPNTIDWRNDVFENVPSDLNLTGTPKALLPEVGGQSLLDFASFESTARRLRDRVDMFPWIVGHFHGRRCDKGPRSLCSLLSRAAS